MKKIILNILLCILTFYTLTGCNKTNKEQKEETNSFNGTIIKCDQDSIIIKPTESSKEYKIGNKFKINNVNSFNACKVGTKVKIEYDGGINESYPPQVSAKEIQVLSEFDFYLKKIETDDIQKYNKYYSLNDRKVYLSSNIEDFYIKDIESDITLKNYLSYPYEKVEDILGSITDKLELILIGKDGGTKIYKSKDKDMTMIVCNTIEGNRDIFIGDYTLKFEIGNCRNN